MPSDDLGGTTVSEITTGPPIDPTVETTGSGCEDGLVPFRDMWRTEATLPFPAGEIERIGIGGRQTLDNFANRGDVIVEFGDAETITIELRRFTIATDAGAAQEDFDRLRLWAFTGTELPEPPGAMDPVDDCTAGWQDGCRIRVFYDDAMQPLRTGADLRVTLPATYRGALEVITEDNDADTDYPDRGNVCVAGLPGSADIRHDSGLVLVALAPTISEVPTCPPQDVAACEAAGWATDCPCLATGTQPFGRLDVANDENGASDVTVDVPSDLWTSIGLRSTMGCEATVALPAYDLDDALGTEATRDPARNQGSANYPGPPAIAGVGYSIGADTSECRLVASLPTHDALVCTGPVPVTPRGDLRVCTDCLPALDCPTALAE